MTVKTMVSCSLILLLAAAASAQLKFSLEETETIRRTLEFSGGAGTKTLEIDNVEGSIGVTGYDGVGVEMTVIKTIRAESQDKIQTAKQEVKLDIADQADTVRLYVDQPDRDGTNRSQGRTRWIDPGYSVEFQFEIRVPRQAHVRLGTVSGDIRIQNVAGDFEVKTVGGRIAMIDVSGSGMAYALSGGITASFASNPKRDSSFGSLSGDVEVTLQPDLAADLRFKSFSGGVYTDFPTSALTSLPGTVDRRDGRFVYRSNGFSGARVGSGGPELKFDGFSGDVRILRAR
jgi:hypothetical protein